MESWSFDPDATLAVIRRTGQVPPATVAKAATAPGLAGTSARSVAALATLAAGAGRRPANVSDAEPLLDFEERAAIAEIDGALPRAHAEVLAAICTAPMDVDPALRRKVVQCASLFLEHLNRNKP